MYSLVECFHCCCNSSCCWPQQQHGVQLGPPATPGWVYEMLQLHRENMTQDGTAAGPVLAIADSSRISLFQICLQRVPGFWECTGGEAATQAPSFPPHVASINLPLMGPDSEMRSGRRNLCVRSYFHLTNHLGLPQFRSCSFYPHSIASSLQTQKVQVETVWEWNNPQAYSLGRGGPWQLQAKS